MKIVAIKGDINHFQRYPYQIGFHCILLMFFDPRHMQEIENRLSSPLNLSPLFPVLLTLSEPARSTKWNFAATNCSSSLVFSLPPSMTGVAPSPSTPFRQSKSTLRLCSGELKRYIHYLHPKLLWPPDSRVTCTQHLASCNNNNKKKKHLTKKDIPHH